MKAPYLLFIGALLAGSIQKCIGQSSFWLLNYFPPVINAPVFDAQGGLLFGANYQAELWGGETTNVLTPAGVYFENGRREFATFKVPGYFESTKGSLSILSVAPRNFAWLQVRVWDTNLGPSYEEVVARGLGGFGESSFFYARGNDPTSPLPDIPAFLIGLQSFSIRAVVPEPATWTLLVCGGVVVTWLMRRRI